MIDTMLVVYECDGTCVRVVADDMPSVDAAVSKWLTETRDSVVYLTGLSGVEVAMLASRITGWHRSTADTRRQHHVIEKALADEQPAEWVD